MAVKRDRRTNTKSREDLSKPSRWRQQHDPVSEPIRGSDPETGRPITQRRMVDTLGQMLTNGSISPAMHEAGGMFRTQFRAAMLDSMRVSALVRVSGGSDDGPTEKQSAARYRVADTLGLFGGADTACGSCLWHVVGMECSVREWAGRQGWGGRSIHHVQGQGILVAALNVLAVHYGLGAAGQGRVTSVCGVLAWLWVRTSQHWWSRRKSADTATVSWFFLLKSTAYRKSTRRLRKAIAALEPLAVESSHDRRGGLMESPPSFDD